MVEEDLKQQYRGNTMVDLRETGEPKDVRRSHSERVAGQATPTKSATS